MSQNDQVPSGEQLDSGGVEPQDKAPSYESHKKLLGEKKKTAEENAALKAKLAEFEKSQKAAMEAKLLEENNLKELLKLREEELMKERSSREGMEASIQRAMKLNAIQSALDGRLSEKYFDLVDADQIAINPTTGRPDETSVAKFAKAFSAKYPEIVMKGTSAQLPNDAAGGAVTKLTYEKWLTLPLKEQKARLKEVMSNNK